MMIILLNGSSSAGKTTLTRALQQHHKNPLLALGIDLFCDMLPKNIYGMPPKRFKV